MSGLDDPLPVTKTENLWRRISGNRKVTELKNWHVDTSYLVI